MSQCPAIFQSQTFPNASVDDQVEEAEREETNLVTPAHLEDISIRDPISRTYIEKTTWYPTRLNNLNISSLFMSKLRKAYEKDYPETSFILPEAKPLTWCCKLAATDV